MSLIFYKTLSIIFHWETNIKRGEGEALKNITIDIVLLEIIKWPAPLPLFPLLSFAPLWWWWPNSREGGEAFRVVFVLEDRRPHDV